MKYSEFKREVEKLGFTYSKRCEQVAVKVDGQTVMDISTGRKYIVDNEWNKYQQLNETTQEQLFDLAYQLAKTPLAEREEEKKYYVKLPSVTKSMRVVYLVKDTSNGDKVSVDWSNEDFVTCGPTIYRFTEQEIKDIDERYLAFKVEVKDE